MSLQTDNVVPNGHGKTFGTDAKTDAQLDNIKRVVSAIEGVKDVVLNKEIFPREFAVHSNGIVKVDAVQDAVQTLGLHAIPKGIFPLVTYTESKK